MRDFTVVGQPATADVRQKGLAIGAGRGARGERKGAALHPFHTRGVGRGERQR